LRQFFMTLAREPHEAAVRDGAGMLGIPWQIPAPLSKPTRATIATFMGSRNNSVGPLIDVNSIRKMTLALGLSILQGTYHTQRNHFVAASLVVTSHVCRAILRDPEAPHPGHRADGHEGLIL
jgi:multiple sugar transport system permease protein